MAQEVLNGLLDYLLVTLNYDNRRWLSEHLIESVEEEEYLTPYTMEEINQRLDEAERDFAEGRYYSHEQVMRELAEL